MDVGAWIGNNGAATPDHMRSVAVAADEHGLASVWAADHIVWPVEYDSPYPYGGDKYPGDHHQPVIESTTTMAWLSAITTRVKIGSLVIVVPQRDPWILGKQLASIDVLNGGRTILGAGMGWLREEFDILHAPFDTRYARGREAIELMRTMWTTHPMHWDGPHFPSPEVGVLPHPPQGRIPVWLGGNTETAQKRVGRFADGWCPFGLMPGEVRTGWDVIRRSAEEAGRDPASITCAAWLPILLSDADDPSFPIHLQGPAGQLVERLQAYADAGLQHLLMFNACAPEATADQIAAIASEVMPALR